MHFYNRTKQYEEIQLKLNMLGEGLYPKNSKPIRQPNDALPDVVGQRENRIGFNFDIVDYY